MASKDDTYNGYFIPKGAIIHGNQFGMFKDPTIYPDPETYNPERWLKPEYPTYQEPLTEFPNLKRFSAFGFGRRICPGLPSAERTLFIEVATLLWACDIIHKLDKDGNVIPVPWYDTRPGNNTGPKHFHFDISVRDPARMHILAQQSASG